MTTALDRFAPVATPSRIGQGTAVEQSRAVAEVQAMVIVAQQMPRDIDRADREMRRSCSRKSMAEKAFYRYSRGGKQVTGETIVLAEELARCWGNIDYGLAELRRDDAAGESEMMAFAWDLETNTRPRTTFIVPHVRMGTGVRLTDPRDIYENNTNMGNRRMREMIFHLMPPWFVEDAKDLCHATLANDSSDGATVAERAATAVTRFAAIGVTAAQLVQKIGAPQARWAPTDLAQLAVIWKSIERGETTADAEFGPAGARVSAADLAPKTASPAAPEADVTPSSAAGPSVSSPGETAAAGEAPATSGQVGLVQRELEKLGYGGDDDEKRQARVRVVSKIVRRPLASTKEMTRDEASAVRDKLRGCATPEDLAALLDEIALADADPREEGADGEQ